MEHVKWAAMAISALALTACGGGGGGGGGSNPPPAQNAPPSFSSPTTFTFAENVAIDFVLTVTDPDSASVTISDDTNGDGALFTVDANSGRVTANTANGAFDFENPLDVNGDNVYEQNVSLSDGQNTVTRTISVTITGVDEPPEFTNEAQVLLNENATGPIVVFTAVDPETGVTSSDYQISEISKVGEVVNAQRLLDAFEVDEQTGELSVVIPFDADTEGTQDIISVEVQATDGNLVGSGSVAIQLVDIEARVVSGIQYRGRDTVNRLGEYAQNVGDIDQDGLPELWVGEGTDEAGIETAYLIWGSTIQVALQDGSEDVSIDTLTTAQAIRITNDDRSATERRTLMNALSAGDVDGDGQLDLLVALQEQRDASTITDAEDGPLAYVVWGDRLQALTDGSLDLATLAAADGIAIRGLSQVESAGLSATTGDFDADGRSDVVFGHPARNQARVLFGSALNKGDASFNAGSATSNEVILLQSLTDTNVIQQIGFDVAALSDLDSDGAPELVVTGAGLEPDLNNGLYIASSQVITAALGSTDGLVNLLDVATADKVVEMLVPEATVAGISTSGDIDSDGVDDLAVAHVGFADNNLVATVVFGATIADAMNMGNDPSLIFTSSTDGINVRITDQILTQENEAPVSAQIVPSFAGGTGSELLIGLGNDSVLGRTNSGSITILTDDALTSAATAEVAFPIDQLPSSIGRKLVGPTTNARIGANAFVSDVDGDGQPDLSMASTTAGPADNGFTNGAYLLLQGGDLVGAFNQSNALFDMATALSNETP